jgi:putative CocE/NonD family hydrolase
MKDNSFRDESVVLGLTLDDMSTRSRLEGLETSGTRIYHWGSWLDAGSADGVIRQFMESTAPQRAVIGAWSHSLDDNTSPFMQPGTGAIPSLGAQWEEALNFFEDLLVKRRALDSRVFRYMVLNTGEWRSTSEWPIPGTEMERFYFSDGGWLSATPPASEDGEDSYRVSFEAKSSDDSRWLSPLFGSTWYPNRRTEDEGLLVYETLPLPETLEVTGYPVIHLYVSSTHSDGAFFVYLEDVDRWGRVTYVTEGILRGIHRKVSEDPGPWKRPTPYHSYRTEDAEPMVPGEVTELAIGLQPTSVLFTQGHRIRVAIAGHDASAFRRIPAEGTPEITLHRNALYASYLEIPVIRQ